MKKIVAILLVLTMVIAAVGCAQPAAPAAEAAPAPAAEAAPAAEPAPAEAAPAEAAPAEAAPEAGTYEVAMITDVGNIDDQSFNQYTWEGTKEWAEANGKTVNYYRPSEDSDEARIETIKTAIEKGAKIVVCPGYLFGASFNTVAPDYPDVVFIGIDLGLGDVPEPTDNVALITYQEEQSGFFAGYATAKAGYTDIAYLGGMAVPAVVRYGFGFLQGLDYAAGEMGSKDIKVKYWYSGSFAPSDDIKTKTSGWYTEGTQVVFACGGGILYSAIASAQETTDGKIVGVDVDQGFIDERIITSAMKDLKGSVQTVLNAINANGGKLPAEFIGVETKLGASTGAVGIPTAEGSFKLGDFTVEEYNAIFEKVKNGEIAVSADIENQPTLANITVDYQD